MERKTKEPDWDWWTYRTLLLKSRLIPNFWTSPFYFKAAGWVPIVRNGWIWWALPDKPEEALIMPIRTDPFEERRHYFHGKVATPTAWHDFLKKNPPEVDFIWSDFGSSPYSPVWETLGMDKVFLDKEFHFSPEDFLFMEGSHWATFRKNSRKWPAANIALQDQLSYKPILKRVRDIERVLLSWLEARPDEVIEDPELLMRYIYEAPHKMGLYRKNQPIGVNLFEITPWGCIFRFSFHIQEPFLSEFLRLSFYKEIDPVTLDVNDGGALGKPGLLFYKQKMNPYCIRDINSWRKI